MLPYQPNCASVVLPPARPAPAPVAIPLPVPVWVAADFFDCFSPISSLTGIAVALSFFSVLALLLAGLLESASDCARPSQLPSVSVLGKASEPDSRLVLAIECRSAQMPSMADLGPGLGL